MDSRREFLKKAALLSGAGTLFSMLPPVIQKALAIDPAPGSTFYDAEHIVFLMQENRSFDHIFGSLQGVRGFSDPRAIRLPNGNPVWLQTDKDGHTYAPFRLNTQDSKAAWIGSLPHGWSDQTDARNDGKYDRWLEVKQARRKDYKDMPLTLGYGSRADFPFYYSLADAFTVCDHNFCSSITGTHSNRHYWMTGSIRDNPADHTSKAHVWNITDYNKPELSWKTFPERLDDNGVSWKVYQNELTMGYGVPDDEWLSNFGTNVLEYFGQYNVRLEPGRIAHLGVRKEIVLKLIDSLQSASASDEASSRKLAAAQKLLASIEADQGKYTRDRYDGLTAAEKARMGKAFTLNTGDPFYHDVTELKYEQGGTTRSLNIPKGDIFHQFRQDVEQGQLPTVSWLSAPANFSDHPSVPWFGPWYVSEVMEILLKNPEVWKKTIVILTYDENDGYFDHLPPFVVPNPYKDESGKVSGGIDPKLDFATKDQQVNPSASADRLRDAPLGLGYRVPMVIASPWTRGGYVNSEVFDHTSSLQFLEHFLSHKTGKNIHEPNITQWRRTICGDLSSAFRPYKGEAVDKPAFIDKMSFIERINEAQFKELPTGYQRLTPEQVSSLQGDAMRSPLLPQQEKGTRPACAAPYELYLDGGLDREKGMYSVTFRAGNAVFGRRAAGAPFYVYAVTPYRSETLHCRNYAVAAGDSLHDHWEIPAFENGHYHLRAYGPNGFYREFRGSLQQPALSVYMSYEKDGAARLSGNVIITLQNSDAAAHTVIIKDRSYKTGQRKMLLPAAGKKEVVVKLAGSHGWYDLSVHVEGSEGFEERFAGKVETGVEGQTDPLMGRMV